MARDEDGPRPNDEGARQGSDNLTVQGHVRSQQEVTANSTKRTSAQVSEGDMSYKRRRFNAPTPHEHLPTFLLASEQAGNGWLTLTLRADSSLPTLSSSQIQQLFAFVDNSGSRVLGGFTIRHANSSFESRKPLPAATVKGWYRNTAIEPERSLAEGV